MNEKKLLTLEEFVSYFQNTILPEYHDTPDTETTIPDLPGWELSKESMSPMQKYRLLEKAKTITPDWSTICVLKMHHSSGHRVGKWGIRFKNVYYQADALAYIVNESVDILYHKVQPPFAPSSITIIHNGAFLCEAFPAEKRYLISDSAIEVMLDSDRQSNAAHEIHAKIKRIRRSSSALLPSEAKSVIKGNGQLYDHTYTAAVSEDLSESMESTEMNESADNFEFSVSKDQIQNGLSFLFGDDFSQDI